MQVTLIIDDNVAGTRLVNDFCVATKYDGSVSKGEWVRANLALYLKQAAKRGEFKTTAETVGAEIDAIVIR